MRLDQFKLDDKVALVTGASRGLGAEIAVALAEAGANVVINYNSSAQAAEETVAEARAFGVEGQAGG